MASTALPYQASTTSRFHCNFSVVYLGDEERTLLKEDQAAIVEAARAIDITNLARLTHYEALWGVSEDKEWAVVFTYVYDKSPGDDPQHLSRLVCHGVASVRDMLSKNAFAHLPDESWYRVDRSVCKIKPHGNLVFSSVYVSHCGAHPPLHAMYSLCWQMNGVCEMSMTNTVLRVAADFAV